MTPLTLASVIASELPDANGPLAIGWVLLALAAIATAIGTLWRFLPAKEIPKVELHPKPITVRAQENYATREELERLRADFAAESSRRDSLTEQRFMRLHERLDRIPGEIFSMIRNLK